MKKLNEQLVRLNTLRTQIGRAPIKEWKESNTKLIEAIRKAEAVVRDNAPTNSQKADIVTMAKDVKAKAKTPKAKAQAEAIIKKAASKASDKAEGHTDRFLGVNPKIARAKLRKAFGSDWKNKTAAEIAAILKPTKN